MKYIMSLVLSALTLTANISHGKTFKNIKKEKSEEAKSAQPATGTCGQR